MWIGLGKAAIEARNPIIRVNIRVFYVTSLPLFSPSRLIIQVRETKRSLFFTVDYGNLDRDIFKRQHDIAKVAFVRLSKRIIVFSTRQGY